MAQNDIITAIQTIMHTKNCFVITGHVNPDEDAVGACLGLGMWLENMGKDVKVILESHVSRINIIPGRHLLFNGNIRELNTEVFICLDCASPTRIGDARILLDKAGCTVCIDHHITNIGFAQYNYIDSAASSTSEMVFRLIGAEAARNKNIASAIYAGIVTDTGGFRFGATSSNTLRAAGQLIDAGIPFTDIYTQLQHMHTFTEAKLLGRVLENCQRCCNERVIYACVSKNMMDDINAGPKDLDGVVEYLLNTSGVDAAVLIYYRNDSEYKVSLRSRRIDVGKIAEMLGGGGHTMAAGCNIPGDIDQVKEKILPIMEQAVMEGTAGVLGGTTEVFPYA